MKKRCKGVKCLDVLLPDFIVSFYIRFFIQQFSPLIFSALINLYDMKFNTQSGQSLGTVLTPVIMIGLAVGVIASFISVMNNREQLDSKAFSNRYGNLVQGLKIKEGTWAPYWNVVILVRWVLTGLVLVGLRDYGSVQICSMLLISLLVQAASLSIRPMKDSWENTMIIVNESFVSAYLYVMMTLSAGIDGNNEVGQQFFHFRDMCGLALVGVVFISIFLNLTKLIMVFVELMRQKYKRRFGKPAVARKSDYLISS